MVKLSAALAVLLAASGTVADLTCANLVPKGFKSNNVKAFFYAFNGYSAPTLNANASVGNPWELSNHNTSTGAVFHIKYCNSTSLGLSPYEQSSCSDAGCYHQYTNYVWLINPSTGHCLTTLNYEAARTQMGFKPCNASATTPYQLFETDQQVQYSMGYQTLESYGEVDLNPINAGPGQEPSGPTFQAWTLSSNYEDIEIIEYMYTQDGLLAQLVQA